MMMTLQAGETRRFPTAGRFLNILGASQIFHIANPDQGLQPTQVKSGWTVELENYAYIELHNPHQSPLDLELQSSQLRINASGSEAVAISNKPVIQRIEEAIQVTAQATVENGTMHTISGATLGLADDVPVTANSKVQLLPANANRKSVLVQVISDTRTTVRLGNAAVTANSGFLVAGEMAAPGVVAIDYSGALYVHNTSNTDAVLSVSEVLK